LSKVDELVAKLSDRLRNGTTLTLAHVVDAANALETSLEDVDRACERLLTSGVLISTESVSEVSDGEGVALLQPRRSKLSKLLSEVIRRDSELGNFLFEATRTEKRFPNDPNTLFLLCQTGNAAAIEALVTRYLGMVMKQALWMARTYGLVLADTFQDGIEGLVGALRRGAGGHLSSIRKVLPWLILRNMQRRVILETPSVGLPVNKKLKFLAIFRISRTHSCLKCGGKEPCDGLVEEIMVSLGCDSKRAAWYLALCSEDRDISGLEELTAVPGESYSTYSSRYGFEEDVARGLDAERLRKQLEDLRPRERAVIVGRFGLDGERELTLQELGDLTGLTREGVRQVEARALRKLRKGAISDRRHYSSWEHPHSTHVKQLRWNLTLPKTSK
jgi:RNA polymerase primary sigma factor